jgi:FtsZ-interacting cell division protein ZipA
VFALIVIGCLAAMVLVGLLVHRRRGPRERVTSVETPRGSGLYGEWASDKDARAAKVLPHGPSENARHVLGSPPGPRAGVGATQHDEPARPTQKEIRHIQDLEDRLADLEDADIGFALVAPAGRPFEGRALWDALTSLGLRWGTMDTFHWPNPHDDEDAGDESLFTVETSTPPRYFIAEEAASGSLHVQDLLFRFPVLRTREPRAVLDAMLRAAKYVQARLGGELMFVPEHTPLDEAELRAWLERALHLMEKAGVTPGSELACRLY